MGYTDSANKSVSGLDSKGLPSALLDFGKAGWNTGVNLLEGGFNLLSGALPGGPDYYAFGSGARLGYDTPVFGEALELLLPLKLATMGGSAAGKGASVEAGWSVPKSVTGKFPDSWGEGVPNNKGVGQRWQDPNNKGNGVRVDQGNPLNTQPVQQVDHVVVRYEGRVIGRDGMPIQGSIKQSPESAHIPLSEYLKWEKWNAPK